MPRVSRRAQQRKRLVRELAVYHRAIICCCHCNRTVGRKHVTLDHIIPRGAGGMKVLGNLALACAACNVERGARDFDMFRLLKARELGLAEPGPLLTPRFTAAGVALMLQIRGRFPPGGLRSPELFA